MELVTDKYLYELRLTPYPNTPEILVKWRERIPSFLMEIGACNYLLGQEYERNHHFHIVFEHPDQYFKDNGKPNAKWEDEHKEFMYNFFDVLKGKKGNATFEFKPIRNVQKALSYAVKDHDYEFSEEWEPIAEYYHDLSFKKHHGLKRSVADITTDYLANKLTDRQAWKSFGMMRAELGLGLSVKYMDEMLFSLQVLKNPDILDDLYTEKEMRDLVKKEKSHTQVWNA